MNWLPCLGTKGKLGCNKIYQPFLPGSLSNLVNHLRKAGIEHFKATTQVFENEKDILDLLLCKQAFLMNTLRL